MQKRRFSEPLTEQQWRQLAHDEVCQNDVFIMPAREAIKHYGLHFAKYPLRALEARRSGDVEKLQGALRDQLIVTFCAASRIKNASGHPHAYFRLHDELRPEHQRLRTLGELAQAFHFANPVQSVFDEALEFLVKIAGRYAKAAEDSDHMAGNEANRLAVVLTESCVGTLRLAGAMHYDIYAAVEAKRRERERAYSETLQGKIRSLKSASGAGLGTPKPGGHESQPRFAGSFPPG